MKPDYSRKHKSESEIEFAVTISADNFDKEYHKQLDMLTKGAKVKGFRKGKAPSSLTESSYASNAMNEALNKLLPEVTTEILIKEKISTVIPVKYSVMKYGVGSDVEFNVLVIIVPEFNIPDFKKIKVQKEKIEVLKKEVDEVLKHLWVEHRNKSKNQDDAWVKKTAPKLGFKSNTMSDLRKEFESSIKQHKQVLIQQKYEAGVLAKIIEISGLVIPKQIIDYEAESREVSFENQIKKLKITRDEFCKLRKVEVDDMKKQWRKDSKEALENDALLSEYSKQRNIEVTDEELESEIKRIKAQSKGKDSQMFDNKDWSRYIERVVLKKKSFKALIVEYEASNSSSKT